jgi:hypothetical protein
MAIAGARQADLSVGERKYIDESAALAKSPFDDGDRQVETFTERLERDKFDLERRKLDVETQSMEMELHRQKVELDLQRMKSRRSNPWVIVSAGLERSYRNLYDRLRVLSDKQFDDLGSPYCMEPSSFGVTSESLIKVAFRPTVFVFHFPLLACAVLVRYLLT